MVRLRTLIFIFSFLIGACSGGGETTAPTDISPGDPGSPLADANADMTTNDIPSTDQQNAPDTASDTSASTDSSPIPDTPPIIDAGPIECGDQLTLCDGKCVNLLSDKDYCGSCSMKCPFGASCTDGICACPETFTDCGGACVNTTSNAAHCGACGESCTSGQVCIDSICTCSPTSMNCGDGCVDVSSDPNNCGGCGFSCSEGIDCSEGSCMIPVPRALSPMSTARTTSDSPLLRWELPAGLDGATVEICNDRLCESIAQYFDVTGTQTQTLALSPGRYFWRLYGRSNGMVSTTASPMWQLRIPLLDISISPEGTHFGKTLDANGDGFDDLVIGSCGAASTGITGGNATPCNNTAYSFLSSVVGPPETPNSALFPLATASAFSFSMAPAGDVNGDGFADFIGGAMGSAHIFHGGPFGLSASSDTDLVGSAFELYGFDVDGVGDINGDGYADVAVSAILASAVYLYTGGPDGISQTAYGALSAEGVGLGASVAYAGDINGDTYPDIITGTSDQKAVVFYGTADGPEANPGQTITGPDGFGISPASAGDLNRDGFGDVVIGAPGANMFFVYYGSADGLLESNPVSSVGSGSFGLSVAGAGDVNGDGYDDLLVASSSEVYFYYGSEGYSLGTPEVFDLSVSGLDRESVTSAGDVNGDGFSDIVIADQNAKKAYVFIGNKTGIANIHSFELGPANPAESFGPNVTGAN